jgi:hypothetical protein
MALQLWPTSSSSKRAVGQCTEVAHVDLINLQLPVNISFAQLFTGLVYGTTTLPTTPERGSGVGYCTLLYLTLPCVCTLV